MQEAENEVNPLLNDWKAKPSAQRWPKLYVTVHSRGGDAEFASIYKQTYLGFENWIDSWGASSQDSAEESYNRRVLLNDFLELALCLQSPKTNESPRL